MARVATAKKRQRKQGKKSRSRRGFLARGQKPVRVGLYARVSTLDQQTLPMQIRTLRAYTRHQGWTIVLQINGIGEQWRRKPA